MGLIVIAVLAWLGYSALQSNSAAAGIPSIAPGVTGSAGALGGVTFATFGPNSDPRDWYQGVKPGTVTVSGKPVQVAGAGLGNVGTAIKASSLAATGAAAAGTVAHAVGSTALASTTALGSALPVIGIGFAVVGTVLGMLSAHHQAAVKAEAQALNDANPRAVNAIVLVVQGVLLGEVTSVAQAQALLEQIVSDWYAEVKPIQKGMWHYSGYGAMPDAANDFAGDYERVIVKRETPPAGAPASDYHGPSTCNGACIDGRFAIEPDKYRALAAVKEIFAGKHGQFVIPDMPAHAGTTGVPRIVVTY